MRAWGAGAAPGAGGGTVVVTTSPVRSHPAARVLEETLASLRAFAKGLEGAPLVLVCDGYKVGPRARHRAGVIEPEEEARYAEYRARLAILARTPGSVVCGAELLCLPCKHGFPMALRRGLQHVRTPFVLVVQHDRTFVRPTNVRPVLRAMTTDPRLRYVGFPTSTTLNHARHVQHYNIRLKMEDVQGASFLPLVQWYDSTHLACTDHYLRFVFGKARRVNFSRNGFVEDRLGQAQLDDIRKGGMAAHAEYGTWLYFDGGGPGGCGDETPAVGHLDGHDSLTADGKYSKFRHQGSHTGQRWWEHAQVAAATEAAQEEIAAHISSIVAGPRPLWQEPVPLVSVSHSGAAGPLPPWSAEGAGAEGGGSEAEAGTRVQGAGGGGKALYVDADLQGWEDKIRAALGCVVEAAPVCLLVPFREDASGKREGQLADFLRALGEPAFRDFLVVVVQQSSDGRRFNRGQLLNAGYRWLVRSCAREGSLCEQWLSGHAADVRGQVSPDAPLGRTLLAFHDVDMPPSDPGLRDHYSCVPEADGQHWVKVVEANWQRYASQGCFGGVTLFRTAGFEATNGFPNSFWGWGGEDNALFARSASSGASVLRVRGGKFHDLEGLTLEQKLEALKRDGSKCKEKRWLLANDKGAWRQDGLADLRFTVLREEPLPGPAVRVEVELCSGGAEKLECGYCRQHLDPRRFNRTKDLRGLESARKKAQLGKLRCIDCTAADSMVKAAQENTAANVADPGRRTCETCGLVFQSRSALFRHLGSKGCHAPRSAEGPLASASA